MALTMAMMEKAGLRKEKEPPWGEGGETGGLGLGASWEEASGCVAAPLSRVEERSWRLAGRGQDTAAYKCVCGSWFQGQDEEAYARCPPMLRSRLPQPPLHRTPPPHLHDGQPVPYGGLDERVDARHEEDAEQWGDGEGQESMGHGVSGTCCQECGSVQQSNNTVPGHV